MLELINLEMSYNKVVLVLKGVSMQVPREGVVALLGANGTGKTTTLKCISGLEHTEQGEVTEGSIHFEGRRIEHMDPTEIVRLGIIQVLEGRRVLEYMTVEQNLMVASHLRKDMAAVRKDLDMVYEYFPLLRSLRKNISGYLSGGEQQMLVIGRAMMAAPKMMLLDEPSLGLAPLIVKEIFNVLGILNKELKTTLLLIEQNVHIALTIAHYGYIMENGRIVLHGTTEDLRNNEDVKEFYFGLSLEGKRRSYRDVKHYRRRKRWLG